MNNDKFSISEALSYGWKAFKNQIGFFIGLIAIVLVITGAMNMVITLLFPQPSLLSAMIRLLAALVSMYMNLVIIRLSLDIYDLGRPQLSKLGALLPIFPPFVGAKIIYGLIIGGLPAIALIAAAFFTTPGGRAFFGILGFVLFLFPGLYWLFTYMYQSYLVVDRRTGPIVSLGESRQITNGSKVSLAIFTLVLILLNLAGAVCVLIGLLVTIPVSMMASIYVYRQLSPAVTLPTVS